MGRVRAKIQDVQEDVGFRKASVKLHPTKPKPDFIRIDSTIQQFKIRNDPFKLQGWPCDTRDGIRYLPFHRTGLMDKLREFMDHCFVNEIRTPLYHVFKNRLYTNYNDALYVMSEVEYDVLYKYRDDPVKMACHVLETCRNSMSFKQACCLLSTIYKPYKEIAYKDMLKSLCKAWFSVDPEELQRLCINSMSQFGCPICQEKLNSSYGVNISALPCGHVFHDDCIRRWLNYRPSCPHCRCQTDTVELLKLFFNYASSDVSFSGDVPSNTTDLLEQNQNLRMEILSCKDRIHNLEENSKEQAKSMDEILNLYNQSFDLLRETNQKYNRAKAQLASYHEVLTEAERMKEECIQLRKHVEQLKDVEVLIRGNESNANELMGKYLDQQGHYSPEVIAELFKWLAVLRSELSDSKLRISKYRKDAYRLRRAHASANNRVSDLERKLENYTNRISQLEADMAQMCEQKVDDVPNATGDSSLNSTPVTPSAINSANETTLDLDRCLSFIDLMSPEINSKDQEAFQSSTANTINTPLSNPFKRTHRPIEKLKPHQKHSSLFKLAIMRDYGKSPDGITTSTTGKSTLYNGFGGQEANTGPTSIFSRLNRPGSLVTGRKV
nr:traf interacting protein [Hymenolepis microstoma]